MQGMSSLALQWEPLFKLMSFYRKTTSQLVSTSESVAVEDVEEISQQLVKSKEDI